MRGAFRIEAYAIASADGHIAAANGLMPDALKLEADQRFFEHALDQVDVVANGRMSNEGQPNSPQRKRLVLTRRVAGVAPDPDNPNARLWNPGGAPLEEACAALGLRSGTVGVIGGPDVYSLFLKWGYDAFYLCHAVNVRLPDGVPVFAEGRAGKTPEEVLSAAGLEQALVKALDDEVTLTLWTPKA